MFLINYIKKILLSFKTTAGISKTTGPQSVKHISRFKLGIEELHRICNESIINPVDVYTFLDELKKTDIKFTEYWENRIRFSISSGLNIDYELEYDDEYDSFINRLKTAILKITLNEFNEIYIELTGMRNYYHREVAEPCDHYEKQSLEDLKRKFVDEANENIKIRFSKIREDVQRKFETENSRGYLTRVVAGAAKALTRIIVSDTFLKDVINRHISDNDMLNYLESLLNKLDKERIEGWIKKEKTLNDRLVNQSRISGYFKISVASPEICEDLSTASKVGGASVAAVAGSTAILAAGWHTLAWAMSGLFVWAMPAVVLFTGILSAAGKESEHNKLMRSIDDEEQKYLEKLNEYIIYRIIPAIETDNIKLCSEIKKNAFAKSIGLFEPDLLDQFIYRIEDYINTLRIEVNEASGENRQIFSSWLIKADSHLHDGDNITAAIISSHAFEDLLHQLNIEFGLKFNFRQQGHNQVFIDYLADNKMINEEHRRILHSLRERRNNFTHRLHLFTMWNKNRQIKEVSRFIDDVNLLFTCYVKS